VAVATIITPANPNVPPGRVRHLFKKLDIDQNGVLSLEELEVGFKTEFGQLNAHANAAVTSLFEAHATDEGSGRGLKINVFNRFYAEILFKHFDADNNGTLQLGEAQEALKFLVKPGAEAPAAAAHAAGFACVAGVHSEARALCCSSPQRCSPLPAAYAAWAARAPPPACASCPVARAPCVLEAQFPVYRAIVHQVVHSEML